MIDLDEPQRALGPVWEQTNLRGREEIDRTSRDVERWEWAGGGTCWERPEPLFAERRGLDPSDRAVKPPTGQLGYLARYGYDADGRITLAQRASGGTVEQPDYRSAAVWVKSVAGDRLLLDYHSEGITKPRPLRLRAITAPVYEHGELRQVARWSGPGTDGSREVYERGADRLTRIIEERRIGGTWEPRSIYDCSYSDGALAAITETRVDIDASLGDPVVVWRRRAARDVRAARRRIERELPDRLLQWASRHAPEDAFAIALLYSSEGPTVPPAIGVGTERDRRRLANGREESSRVWNPAEWEHLDAEPVELLADGLDECWRVVQREWEASATDEEPRALLLKALRAVTSDRLQAAGLPEGVAIFAIDDELTDLERNLPGALPTERRRELES